jgi:GTPase Era involved in 16S rRNA processing
VAEAIREKIFRLTNQEIPYACAVRVEELTERERPEVLYIKATIFVEQDSQKGIVIGKQGAMLKRIGSTTREDLERFFGIKTYLGPAGGGAQELEKRRGGAAGVRLPPHVLSMTLSRTRLWW